MCRVLSYLPGSKERGGIHGDWRQESSKRVVMSFEPGQSFDQDGIQYRVIPGRRGPNDTIIQFRILPNGEWYTPHLSHLMILTAFQCQVQDNLYPDGQG